jgi:hypothetical protein
VWKRVSVCMQLLDLQALGNLMSNGDGFRPGIQQSGLAV